MGTSPAEKAAPQNGFQFPWANAQSSGPVPTNPQMKPVPPNAQGPQDLAHAQTTNGAVRAPATQTPAGGKQSAFPNPANFSRPSRSAEDAAERRHRETMEQTERLHKKGIWNAYGNTALYGVVAAGAGIPGNYLINSIPKATAPATTGSGMGSMNATSTLMPHTQPTTNASQYHNYPGVANMMPDGTPTAATTAQPRTSWLTPEEIQRLGQPPQPPSSGVYTTVSGPKQTPMGTRTSKVTQW